MSPALQGGFLTTGCCSVAQSCLTLGHPVDCSMPGFPVFAISWSLLKPMSIESVMPPDHLILSLPSPPALNLSQHLREVS